MLFYRFHTLQSKILIKLFKYHYLVLFYLAVRSSLSKTSLTGVTIFIYSAVQEYIVTSGECNYIIIVDQ